MFESTRRALSGAVLKTAVEFEQVYLPTHMEKSLAPQLSRISDAEFEQIQGIRRALFDLKESLDGPRKP